MRSSKRLTLVTRLLIHRHAKLWELLCFETRFGTITQISVKELPGDRVDDIYRSHGVDRPVRAELLHEWHHESHIAKVSMPCAFDQDLVVVTRAIH